MIASWLLVAQTTTPSTQPASGASEMFWTQLVPILLMVAVFYWILFRGQRKERQRHIDMLSSIKRADRVQTIGGIYGTVVDVRDSEVVLKIDETSNVKVRVNRQAIKEILREAAAPGAAGSPSPKRE
ncbi:MAG: preprotein translocase subunit YajC [Phycisphaerae bacterium]